MEMEPGAMLVTMRTHEANEKLALCFLQAFNGKDFPSMKSMLAPDASWTPMLVGLPLSKTYRGDQIFDEFLAPIIDVYAPGDPKHEVRSIAVRDDVVFVETHAVGDVKAKGRIYSNDYVWTFRISGNRIISIREYFDTAYAIRTLLE